jgi:hypothetical protein
MSLGRPLNLTGEYKQNVYQINLDVSGWDKIGVHLVTPLAAPIYVYGSNDGGALQGVRDGNAELATNFTPIQATSLATGTAANSMATAGGYTVPVNLQYMRFAGGGADVYKILVFETKVS